MVPQVILEETENLLCLSPSRLILAFGVILFILLLALVFACMLWMRARNAGVGPGHSRLRMRPKSAQVPPGHTHLPPPAMIARAPHGHGPPPVPPPRPVGPARGFFVRGRMPYIRVVH